MYDKCSCKRCGYVWQPRIDTKPRQCPRCKSPFWDTDKKRGVVSDIDVDSVSLLDPANLVDPDTVVDDPEADAEVAEADGRAILDVMKSGEVEKKAAEIAAPPAAADKKLKELGVELHTAGSDADTADGKKSDVPPEAAKKELTKVDNDLGLDFDNTDEVKTTFVHSDPEDTPRDPTDAELEGLGAAIADGEISGAPPVAEGGDDTPEGYLRCPHCDALNEKENRAGVCSSCGKVLTEVLW